MKKLNFHVGCGICLTEKAGNFGDIKEIGQIAEPYRYLGDGQIDFKAYFQ
jgi:hypothetical protein